jgi:phosphorylcholine metabolism protein LicD
MSASEIELSPKLTPKSIENIKAGQVKMTQMFKEFDRICRKHNLKYWCVGGTLIGAIRHKGWIPWDGDIDVHMFDYDWEKFKEIAHSELPTTCAVFDGDIGKIKDLYSSYINQSDTSHTGLQIDVFKYKDTFIKDQHAVHAYINIWRGDYFYKDTGSFHYDLIFPLKELEFEGISVYVPGKYEKFCQQCYDTYPPPMPPVEKRYPNEGLIDPYNPNVKMRDMYKELYTERTQEWFRRRALQHSSDTPLHHSSGWNYLTDAKWLEFIQNSLNGLDIKNIKSVFEGGCGVGAVLKALCIQNPLLELHGLDICKEAVERCKENVPNIHARQGSITDLSMYETNQFDFVISNCVLSYLDSLSDIKVAVDELIRITKSGHRVHLCVFTENPEYLKSLRTCVSKSWWLEQFSDKVEVNVRDIGMSEFSGRYSVFMIKK